MAKKRNLALALGLVLVTALVSVGGTIAWLTDKTEPVQNVFTVGNIDIELNETGIDEQRTKEFKMIPGNTLAKDPKVSVDAGSEDCWLFVEVTESDNLDNFIEYSIATGWEVLTGTNKSAIIYRKVLATDTTREFSILSGDTVKVLDDVSKEMMDALTDDTEPTLTFKAYAIQLSKFDNASAAWTELNTKTQETEAPSGEGA